MQKTMLPGRILYLFLIPVLLVASIPTAAQTVEHNQMVAELIDQVDTEAIQCTIEHLQDDQGSVGLDDDGTRFTPTLNATDNVKDIVDQFEAYGLETEVDTFFPTQEDCDSITNGMDAVCPPDNAFQNVIATLEGRDSSQYYLVMAHYDTINDDGEGWYSRKETIPAPGANDNASGVAIMIEVARVLSNSTFNYDIRFAALAAEEWGFLGSRRYVAQAIENGDHIAGFINIDMVGLSDAGQPNIYVYYKIDSPDSLEFAEAIIAANTAHQIMSASLYAEQDWSEGLSGRSDQAPFWTAGISNGVYLGAVKDAADFDVIDSTYHTEDDVLYNPDGTLRLSADQLESVTQLTVASIASFAQPVEVNPAPQAECPSELSDILPAWTVVQKTLEKLLQEAELWFEQQGDLLWQRAQDWLATQWNSFIELLENELTRILQQAWQSLVEQCLGSSALLLLPVFVVWGKVKSSRHKER